MILPLDKSQLRLSSVEWSRSMLYAAVLFALMGTLTALWSNPFFVRMTPVYQWDYLILSGEAILLGLYLGIKAPSCGIKRASIGGIAGFLGFGCSLCNKLLVLALGSSFLLNYFEPIRLYIGLAGLVILSLALMAKLGRRGPRMAAPVQPVS